MLRRSLSYWAMLARCAELSDLASPVHPHMLRHALAKYSGEQSQVDQLLYEAAEDQARAEGIGLWRDPNPVPWEWRRR